MAKRRRIYVAVFGYDHADGEPGEDPWKQKEETRDRQWQVLPRELKLAIKRVHVKLGHASQHALDALSASSG